MGNEYVRKPYVGQNFGQFRLGLDIQAVHGLIQQQDFRFHGQNSGQRDQPLFATGDYRDFREFARAATFEFNEYGTDNESTITYDADADGYDVDPDGPGEAESFSFGNPDFNFKSLKINAVLRWEYRPGSTFYLVWTQNRTDFADPGDFDFSRDWNSLMGAESEDIVLVKATRWFDL